MINFQRPTFPDLFRNKHFYIATALETQEQVKKTALNYCTHKFHPRWPVLYSSLAMFRSHVDIFSLHRGIFSSRRNFFRYQIPCMNFI